MSSFKTSDLKIGLTGETHVTSGVEDKSNSIQLDGYTSTIEKATTAVQEYRLESGLTQISEEERKIAEERNAAYEAIMKDPAIKGFDARLSALAEAEASLPKGAFEAQAKAEYKRVLNATPGLSKQLSAVYKNHMNTDAFALEYAASKSKSGSSGVAVDPIQAAMEAHEKHGIQKLGMGTGWIYNKADRKQAELNQRLRQEANEASSRKTILEYKEKQKQIDKDEKEELLEDKSKELVYNLAADYQEQSRTSIKVDLGGGGQVDVNNPAQMVNLEPEQRIAAQRTVARELNQKLTEAQMLLQNKQLSQTGYDHMTGLIKQHYEYINSQLSGEGDLKVLNTQKDANQAVIAMQDQAVLTDWKGKNPNLAAKLVVAKEMGIAQTMGLALESDVLNANYNDLKFYRGMGEGTYKMSPAEANTHLNAGKSLVKGLNPEVVYNSDIGVRESVAAMIQQYIPGLEVKDGTPAEMVRISKILADPNTKKLVEADPELYEEGLHKFKEGFANMAPKIANQWQQGYTGEWNNSGLFVQLSDDGQVTMGIGQKGSGTAKARAAFKEKVIAPLQATIDSMVALGDTPQAAVANVRKMMNPVRSMTMYNNLATQRGRTIRNKDGSRGRSMNFDLARDQFDAFYGEGSYDALREKMTPEKPTGTLRPAEDVVMDFVAAVKDGDATPDEAVSAWREIYPEYDVPEELSKLQKKKLTRRGMR